MLWENFKEFWARPYRGASEMDAMDWFLWVGLILLILMVWGLILRHLRNTME